MLESNFLITIINTNVTIHYYVFKKMMGFVLNHPTFCFFFYKLSVSLCQEGRTIAL